MWLVCSADMARTFEFVLHSVRHGRAVPDHEFTGFRIPDINRIVNS